METNRAPSDPSDPACCIAGCGPAGAVLGLLLARAGVPVLVLEKHDDFFRDFRGDTVHPSTLDVIEELGLLDRFNELPHRRVPRLNAVSDQGSVTLADFSLLRARHPYIAMVPQWDFLDLIASEARRYPWFRLETGAEALDLLREDGRVQGLRYRTRQGDREVRAPLTVAADGRHSVLRDAAGLEPVRYGAPMDVLWFRLSRRPSDPEDSFGRLGRGQLLALINRTDYWQIAYVVPKGSAERFLSRGTASLRSSVAALTPFLADRVDELADPASVRMLEVQVNRLRRWHRPGLLFIGDAAHAMSPVGGVGINLAIQDAVATANLLVEPLLDRAVDERDLARVQRRRRLPTVATQTLQRVVQRRFLRPLLAGERPATPPAPLRLAARSRLLRRIPARVIGVGIRPEHVRTPSVPAASPQEPAVAEGRVQPPLSSSPRLRSRLRR